MMMKLNGMENGNSFGFIQRLGTRQAGIRHKQGNKVTSYLQPFLVVVVVIKDQSIF